MLAHLESLEIEFTQRQVDEQGMYQLFMIDPNGVKIEIGFSAEEAKDIQAEVMASELPD